MTRTPPLSRRVSAARKQPTAGPSKPRKTRVAGQQIIPSNITNLRTQRRSSRLLTHAPSDPGLAPPIAATRLQKGKKRMKDVGDMVMNMGLHVPSEPLFDVAGTPQRIEQSRGLMIVDDMVEDIRALRVSEPPTMQMGALVNPVNALQLDSYAHVGSKPATPLRREARIGDPRANADVAPIENRKKEKGKDPKPQPEHPPCDFKPLLRDPLLLVPQETSNPDYFDWEKRREAARIRNAVAVYRTRNLEGIIPLKNWDVDDIVAWALKTPFVTGKLFKPVHIPRPELAPLCTTELSDLSLVYHWVRRIATLACKAVSMTIQTPLAPDLHTRWEVMNTKAPDPYFGYMCFMPFNGYEQWNPATVVIGVQTPFGLNPDDFMEIVRGGSFPYTPNVPLQGKYHSWANLYDACKQRGTRWFALTSYCQWVFGIFSVDYATALVSPIYAYNTRAPNIVELVAYWFASARNGHGTFVPPKIDVAVGYKLKEVQNERIGMTPERQPGKPPIRQDYWDRRDSDFGTKTSILTRTDGTITSLYPDSEQRAFTAAKVNSWNSPFPKAPLDNRLWETVQTGFAPPPMQGEWMVPIQ